MKKYTLGVVLAAASMVMCIPACTGNGPKEDKTPFTFTVVLASGKSTIEFDSSKTDEENAVTFTDAVAVIESNVKEKNGQKYFYATVAGKETKIEGEPEYKITVNKPEICAISTENLPAPEAGKKPVARTAGIKQGNVIFTVTEQKTGTRIRSASIPVADQTSLSDGGYNFSNAADSKEQRQEILGKLEKYAMDAHLTGITLFENGGYVKYNPRIIIPANEYITGYGFGILSEGSIDPAGAINDGDFSKKNYYHSSYGQDPLTIAAMNASGSQVSDLAGYITAGYYGTKMNATKNGYDWYPVLAKDTVNGEAYLRPTPVDANGKSKYDAGFEADPLGIYNSWRVYVKTGAEEGVAYRATGAREAEFDNKGIAVEDYVTPFKMLLTGANKLSRGAEMAADTSYGIKGAQAYYNRTKDLTSWEEVATAWNTATTPDEDGEQDLGIKYGTDARGSYIEIELINAIDDFTAMYTLSSNLYSPIPLSFLERIGGGDVLTGTTRYGNFNSGSILDYTINVGPYLLESWADNQMICFKRNDNWYEVAAHNGRYNIEGVKLLYIDSSSDTEANWKEFNNGKLDATGIPTKQLDAHSHDEGVRQTKGDSTFKLNVNSCTQERWNELFGSEGKINKNSTWTVKPWMSNDNFVKGLFHAINREEFALKRGVQPSINYFSDAYLSDPEAGVSYNSTEEHEKAVAAYQTYKTVAGEEVSTYGYSQAEAVSCFQRAIAELEANGDIRAPQELKIHIRWMYATDIKEYGEDIARYFTEAFSAATTNYTLKVEQEAVTQWEDVYNKWMMVGQFDLGFGAISGNTYNPLNFLEVLKSDNSSGFTLNWGADTSKVDPRNPIVYKGQKWSFDALWAVADHGGVVEQGRIAKPVKTCYMKNPMSIANPAREEFNIYNGVTIEIPVEFTAGANTEFAIKTVKVYLLGIGYIDSKKNGFSVEISADGKLAKVTISATLAGELNTELEKQVNGKKKPGDENYITDPFTYANYYKYWELTLFYTISINGATPSLNTMTVYKTLEDNELANLD